MDIGVLQATDRRVTQSDTTKAVKQQQLGKTRFLLAAPRAAPSRLGGCIRTQQVIR